MSAPAAWCLDVPQEWAWTVQRFRERLNGYTFWAEDAAVVRSQDASARWRQDLDRLNRAEHMVRRARALFRQGRLSADKRLAEIKKATRLLASVLPREPVISITFTYDLGSSYLDGRDEGPLVTEGTLIAIKRASVRERWVVALRHLLSAGFRRRMTAREVVAKARELSAGLFPAGDVEGELITLAGIRLGRLTDKARGGGGRRSVGAVVEALRLRFSPSEMDQVLAVVRANPGIHGDNAIAEVLSPIRRDRVTAARRVLVEDGRLQNRGTRRRPRLFVPEALSLLSP
jgi:hypothetical protein